MGIFSLFLGWQLSKLQKNGLLWFGDLLFKSLVEAQMLEHSGDRGPWTRKVGRGFWMRTGRWLAWDGSRGGRAQRNRQKKKNSAAAPINTRALRSQGGGKVKKKKHPCLYDWNLAAWNLKWSGAMLLFIYGLIFFQEVFGSSFSCSSPAEKPMPGSTLRS